MRKHPQVLFRIGKILAANAAALLAIITVVELIYGRWLKNSPLTAVPEIARTAGKSFNFRTHGLTGEDVEVVFARDQYGLRGYQDKKKPLVLVLGGSTGIEQNVPLASTWAEVLEKALAADGLPVEIANASVAGHTLFGNAYSIVHWLSALPLQPKALIIYYGHNDAVYTLNGIPPEGRDLANQGTLNFNDLISRYSALASLKREILGNYQSIVSGNRHLYNFLPLGLPSLDDSAIFPVPAIDTVVKTQLYREAFASILSAASKTYPHAKVIFIAQSEPDCRFVGENHYIPRDSRRNEICERLAAFHRYVAQRVRQLKDQRVAFIPLYLHNPYDRRGASDYIHTNSRGSRAVGRAIAPLIREHIQGAMAGTGSK